MQVTRKDVLWNYAATFLKVTSSVLLLPLILRMMPTEMVGIWSVFITITAFAGLLDFGFGPSFTRNITYIFSGVSNLKVTGIESVSKSNFEIDYGLLKGTIQAMRWFYLRMSLIVFVLLSTIGTYYIFSILKDYNGIKSEIYIAWILLCFITTYSLFTFYYDSLLLGIGLIKKSKQITIIGQTMYLVFAAILIILGFGLVAIVSSQIISVIIIRWLSYKAFYTTEIKNNLSKCLEIERNHIIKAIYPNAIKIGLTTLGGVAAQRSTIVIGSLYLSLGEIASFSITSQIIAVIATMSRIYIATFQPKIAQLRVLNDTIYIKKLYLQGLFVFTLTFIIGGTIFIFFGKSLMDIINSQTPLLSNRLILFLLFIAFFENNYNIAIGILLSNNEVPFFLASLLTGLFTVLLLILFFNITNLGIWILAIAPAIAYSYNNFKWPTTLFKQLQVRKADIIETTRYFLFNGSAIIFKR